MMRCGRISVEGEAEDVIDVLLGPGKPRLTKKKLHRKITSFNPYSALGLEKFASLSGELSAKREYVARNTGNPEAVVKFVYTHKGWVPLVVKNGGVSIPPNIRTNQDNQIKGNYNSNQKKDDGNPDVKAIEGFENGANGSGSSQESAPVIMSWWSGYLRATAFGVLTLSANLVRKSAADMAVVVVMRFLQKLWLGGVMCMKRFIYTGIPYFSEFFLYWNRSPEIKTSPPQGSLKIIQPPPVASAEHKMIISKKVPPVGPLLWSSAPCSPTRRGQATAFSPPQSSTRSQEFNIQQQQQDGKEKNNVAMNGQSKKPIKLQQLENLTVRSREGRGAIDANVGAILMILLLFFLVFYGKLCAICFTSAWWYVLPKLRIDSNNHSRSNNNNSIVVIDLQSREYKKKVIMDGLLHRDHSRAV